MPEKMKKLAKLNVYNTKGILKLRNNKLYAFQYENTQTIDIKMFYLYKFHLTHFVTYLFRLVICEL